LGEVYEGAFRRPDSDVAFARYRHFLNGYRVLPLDDGTMLLFAEHRARLRSLGTMLADMDLLIACTALQHDLALVTRNLRHFARVPGLRLQDQPAT
jgi:tRNA(fMet)-specific endonuclease VapC